jgi:hypothetical protein
VKSKFLSISDGSKANLTRKSAGLVKLGISTLKFNLKYDFILLSHGPLYIYLPSAIQIILSNNLIIWLEG